VFVTELMARLRKSITINMQTITLTCATSAAYASHCPTAPCNQLMAQRQLSWNPTALSYDYVEKSARRDDSDPGTQPVLANSV